MAFVGGGKEAYCLMEPLFQLSKVDETTVRDQAVKALNLVSESMSPPHIVQYFAPKVVELFNKDWWPPRVSAVGLVVAAFNGCHAASSSRRCWPSMSTASAVDTEKHALSKSAASSR